MQVFLLNGIKRIRFVKVSKDNLKSQSINSEIVLCIDMTEKQINNITTMILERFFKI